MEAKFYLKHGKEKSLERYHQWVFSGAIQRKEGQPEDGDIVAVYTHQGQFLARGHFNNGSIMVRVISFEDIALDLNFWTSRLQMAYNLRNTLNLTENLETNVYRLVHGEGDFCPGLVIDYYNQTLVIQAHSKGIYKQVDIIAEALKVVYGEVVSCIILKCERSVQGQDRVLFGEPSKIQVQENGFAFMVDPLEGQKTGFFIDQRENRALLGKYAAGKKVMNLFGYTGGFSVYARGGGAALVHTIDVSEKAVQQANENIALNFNEPYHEGKAADAFDFFKDLPVDYDIMVLDPPAFAKHQNALSNARQAYIRLNKLAFEKIKPGGIVFTFSCSQVISKDIFRSAVFTAALQANRKVSILHQLSQAADHPVNIFHPEAEYLKGLVVYVH